MEFDGRKIEFSIFEPITLSPNDSLDVLDANNFDCRDQLNDLLYASNDKELLNNEFSSNVKFELGKDKIDMKIESLFEPHENVPNPNEPIILPYEKLIPNNVEVLQFQGNLQKKFILRKMD